MINKPTILFLFSLLTAALAFPGYAAAELRIGLSLPFSGNTNPLAKHFLQGAQLAVEEFNQTSNETATLITVDDGCSEEISQLAVEELRAVKLSLITGLLCNEPAYEIATAFSNTGIPVLVAGARSERLVMDQERNGWNIWRLSPGDNEAAEYAASRLIEKWRGKAYAIVDDGTVHGRNLADSFRQQMEEKGAPPQFQDNFRPTQSTQARLIRRLKKAGITHVFIGASPEDVVMISRNAAEMGIDLQLASGEFLNTVRYMEPAFYPAPGLVSVMRVDGMTNPGAAMLAKKLADANQEESAYTYLGYQALQVSLAAAGTTNQETTSNLNSMIFDTILGAVSFAPDGSNAISPYQLRIWQGESFELLPVN